jgi:excisionase family DNA binding protein
MDKLLTKEEIAGYLHLSPRTIESWVWREKIPYIKIGRCVRFDLGQIQEWLKAKTRGAMDMQSTAHQA